MVGAIDKESKMKFIACAATLVFLLWGTPVMAGPCVDDDADGVCDVADNCILPNAASIAANPAQDDTDGDDCGNICDPDYDQIGGIGFADVIDSINNGLDTPSLGNENRDHTEPIGSGVIGFADVIRAITFLATPPGPSGTTAGTTACP